MSEKIAFFVPGESFSASFKFKDELPFPLNISYISNDNFIRFIIVLANVLISYTILHHIYMVVKWYSFSAHSPYQIVAAIDSRSDPVCYYRVWPEIEKHHRGVPPGT